MLTEREKKEEVAFFEELQAELVKRKTELAYRNHFLQTDSLDRLTLQRWMHHSCTVIGEIIKDLRV